VKKACGLTAVAVLLVVSSAIPPASSEENDVVAPAHRDVTPPGFTAAPVGSGPLIREKVPPPPPEPARWRRFFLPETTDAATFKTDKLTIHISGVTPLTIDQVCGKGDGEWPCGRTALFSFRLFLRGRAVECYFPRPEGVEAVVAPCRVGQTDLGSWLLGQGWAKPDGNATEDYRATANQAACDGKGLWRGELKPADC